MSVFTRTHIDFLEKTKRKERECLKTGNRLDNWEVQPVPRIILTMTWNTEIGILLALVLEVDQSRLVL